MVDHHYCCCLLGTNGKWILGMEVDSKLRMREDFEKMMKKKMDPLKTPSWLLG